MVVLHADDIGRLLDCAEVYGLAGYLQLAFGELVLDIKLRK